MAETRRPAFPGCLTSALTLCTGRGRSVGESEQAREDLEDFYRKEKSVKHYQGRGQYYCNCGKIYSWCTSSPNKL
ncbi:hypothetical protein GN956_G186 [Arapaima gigas]